MGKKTKAPKFVGGSVSINGRNVASTQKVGDTVVSNYNMSDAEKNIYDSVLNNMSSSLSGLFSISDPQRKAWNQQLDAMKQQGIDNINSIFTPLQENLKSDIAARFGNLDNSSFLNNLQKITDNKSKAVADLSNSLALAQNDLYTNELQNRMNVINLLNGLNNSFNSNMLSYMGLANNNIPSGNSYNLSAYNANTSMGSALQYAKLASQLVSLL